AASVRHEARAQGMRAVAHRVVVYATSGTPNGVPFDARGIDLDAVHSHTGWNMSAMAWDDERPGLCLAETGPKGPELSPSCGGIFIVPSAGRWFPATTASAFPRWIFPRTTRAMSTSSAVCATGQAPPIFNRRGRV